MTWDQSTHILTWPCTGCRFPIEDGTGYLRIADSEAGRAQQARRNVDRSGPVSTADLIDLVDSIVHWHAYHWRCDPHPDAGYTLDVEGLRTHADLLRWTSHLMSKSWLGVTDWAAVIRSKAEEVSRGA